MLKYRLIAIAGVLVATFFAEHLLPFLVPKVYYQVNNLYIR